MATASYRNWVKAGRPFRLAGPISEYRKALREAGFNPFDVGTLGDERHLMADPPEDHTPFSRTGWPDDSPYPVVMALDLSGLSGQGHTWLEVIQYWLEEARAGRTPWVKYIVLQGMRYDVRNGWRPVVSSGHYLHGHLSIRTDWATGTIGNWKVLPRKETDMDQADRNVAWATTNRALAILTGEPCRFKTSDEEQPRDEGNWLADAVRSVQEDTTELVGRSPVTVDPLALAQALVAQEGFIDTLATVIASKLGMIPTAGEIARAVGALEWHGVVR